MLFRSEITVRNFFENARDLRLHQYNDEVMAENKVVESVATKDERRQVEITNEYRIMMGHRRAVRINDKLTVNLGVRYDANDGTDQGGLKVVSDSRFSPRLSASYDVKGDGKLVIVGGYSRYVVGMAQGVADAGSAAGGVVYNT